MVEPVTTLERVAETPYLEFERQIQDTPVAIIYPRHRSRGALVSMFLEHYEQNIVYYNLEIDDNSLTTWLALVTSPGASLRYAVSICDIL